MANPFSQQVRQRKVIYFALILVLFSVGLMHRKWWIEEEAARLKLREVAKGEVELTSSAVRLSLTGSRGLAVTFLWSTALKQQERHEWNELELVIGAVTKLQPYFITPWLFQGWNLAYNVSVECDRPHDKFYYVSRGLKLLAEGERRNTEQSANPGEKGIGQPDLRYFIAVAYQGKFGISDEKTTMRSLLDLSCIDPIRRDPERFWKPGEGGRRTVDLAELQKLCEEHPRLVRRLRDHLGYSEPQQIIAFLTDNREVPSRFEPSPYGHQKETPLKSFRDQFPTLPAPQADLVMDATQADFGLRRDESFDAYVVARTWFEFAQQPVPPPSPNVVEEISFDPLKYRLPKSPSLPIYRGSPSRAQMFSAEVLEEEGWFDDEGWLVRDWFENLGADAEFRVGAEPKYHAQPAWDRAYRSYKELGTATGQYLAPAEKAKLEQTAQLYRKTYNIDVFERGPLKLPANHRDDPAMKASWQAHLRIVSNAITARMTNYEGLFHQSEAERTSEQIAARKMFYHAERLRRFENPEQALAYYDAAWPLWLTTSLRFPKFNEIASVQEDGYEFQLKHLRLLQKQYPALYRALATGMAEHSLTDLSMFKALLLYRAMAANGDKSSVPPRLTLEDLLDPSDKSRILPIRNIRGLLDAARYYSVAEKDEVSRFLLAWSQAAGTPRLWLPGQEAFVLMTFENRDRPLQPGWKHLCEEHNILLVKQRYGLLAPPAPPEPDASMAPPDPPTPLPLNP